MYFVAQTAKLTVRATNLNFLEFKASAGPKVLISLLYGYVEGHMTLDDFSWTDPLRKALFYEYDLLKVFCRMGQQLGQGEAYPSSASRRDAFKVR